MLKTQRNYIAKIRVADEHNLSGIDPQYPQGRKKMTPTRIPL